MLTTALNTTLNNYVLTSALTLTNAGTGVSLVNTTTAPTLKTKSITAGNNILITDTGTDIKIDATVVLTGTAYQYQPSNFSQGGQITISGSAFYKLEYAPVNFTTTQLKYWKLNTTSTTLSFALYSSTGSLLAYNNNHVSTTVGLNTINWNTSITFTAGQPFYFSHSTNNGTSMSTLVFGIGLSATNINSSLYFYTNYWTSGTAPSSVVIGGTGTSTAIMWYILG